MKKRTGILFAMAILIGIPVAVRASEPEDTAIKSYGSIFYEDATGSVKICAEDIVLLQEKLASVPDEIFDPILYSHSHVWEYIDITDQSHTKHCKGCGAKYDLVNPHTAAKTESCTIFHDGHEYDGYKYVCECGYQWEEEVDHTPVYILKDEVSHTLSCALNGTSYCPGLEPVDTPHGIIESPTDSSHHQHICNVCDYKGEVESCVFDILDDSTEEVRKYCVCGNYITEAEAGVSGLGVTELEMMGLEAVTEEGVPVSEETEETEKKTEASDPSELPEISVSGNDCTENLEGE